MNRLGTNLWPFIPPEFILGRESSDVTNGGIIGEMR